MAIHENAYYLYKMYQKTYKSLLGGQNQKYLKHRYVGCLFRGFDLAISALKSVFNLEVLQLRKIPKTSQNGSLFKSDTMKGVFGIFLNSWTFKYKTYFTALLATSTLWIDTPHTYISNTLDFDPPKGDFKIFRYIFCKGKYIFMIGHENILL